MLWGTTEQSKSVGNACGRMECTGEFLLYTDGQVTSHEVTSSGLKEVRKREGPSRWGEFQVNSQCKGPEADVVRHNSLQS